MARGQMEGIHLLFILFLNSLTMNYTTSNLATYLEVVLGWTTYHHQDGDIPNTGIMLVLLDRGWMVDERYPYIFYTLSRQFDHQLHLIWAGQPTKKCHDNEANISNRTVTLLKHNSCGSSCIMARGQIRGVNLFFILFLNRLTMNYTTSNLATYLEVLFGWTKYHHQDCDTRNTGIMLVLLDHG
jgi:hypothetical protein